MQVENLINEIKTELPADRLALVRQQLAEQINWLIVHDFNQLVTILYRIDINEQKLKRLLQENAGTDAAGLIADLIIQRQLEKIKLRQVFKNKPPVDDEEKW